MITVCLGLTVDQPDEQAYVRSSNTEDVEMRDAEDDSDDEEAVEDQLSESNAVVLRESTDRCTIAEEEESEDEEDELEHDEDELPDLPAGRNEQLTVGYKGDRSFVVRGNNIGVFSHSGDSEVKFVGTIKQVATPKGKTFKPGQVSNVYLMCP